MSTCELEAEYSQGFQLQCRRLGRRVEGMVERSRGQMSRMEVATRSRVCMFLAGKLGLLQSDGP
jgi:hypothetical protein